MSPPSVFSEPTADALKALRGNIQQYGSDHVNGGCDSGICNACNCNCDDGYGIRARQRLKEADLTS